MSSTINLPQLILVLLLSILAIRYFFFSPSPSSPSTSNPASTSTSNSNHANHASNHERINPQHVDQLASMFPQVSRRDIMWDLQRNGGSVAATSERILGGGGLDFPPPSFQPPLPTSTSPSPSAASSTNPEAQLDLIQRYNLSGKLGVNRMEEAGTEEGKKGGWSSSKSERQALLQRRREEVILGARRALEEQEGKGKGNGVGG